jgi:DNA polymerase-1
VIRVAFDIETHLIKPGQLFPKLVCVTTSDGQKEDIYLASLGVREIIRLLQDPNVILVGHNVAFDLGVIIAEAIDQGVDPDLILSLVFHAYADDRIADTMIRTMLVDIAEGKFQEIDGQRRGKVYGLDRLGDRWLGLKILKKDTWRLHYAALDGVPLAQWPQDAKDYALTDARTTWNVDNAITIWAVSEGLPSPGNIPDEFRQHRAAWVLHLMAGWGVSIDSEMVKVIRSNLEAQRDASYQLMDQFDLFKKDKYGQYKLTKKGQRSISQKKLKELIAEGYAAQGETPPMTAGRKNKQGIRVPEIGTSADAARDSGHVAAIAYADVSNAVKLLSTYVPALERGSKGYPVTSSPNVLVASGRTSWTGPNWQNPPQVGGIRECVIPRPGKVFVAADLDTVELRALAQSCLELFGWSDMAAALQRGEDLALVSRCGDPRNLVRASTSDGGRWRSANG